MIYIVTTEFQQVSFSTFEGAEKFSKENDIIVFRDNFGSKYYI
jgi:hypothetical protein